MAIAAKKVEIAKDGDTTVGCVTDIVVDTEEGIVAEKKTFAVSVPDGKGGTTVVYGQAIQATKIPDWINSEARTQRLAITDGQTTTSNYNTSSSDTDLQPYINFCVCCLFGIVALVVCLGLSILIAAGPLASCTPLKLVSWLTLFQPIFILLICCCCSCYLYAKKEFYSKCSKFTLYSAIFFIMGLTALVVSASVYMYGSPFEVVEFKWTSGDCRISFAPFVALMFSYLFCFIFIFTPSKLIVKRLKEIFSEW